MKKIYYQLKISPEYGASPIWYKATEDDFFDNLELTTANFKNSLELLERIQSWDNKFQSTFNKEYPPESGFLRDKERNEYLKELDEIKNTLRGFSKKEIIISINNI